MMSSMPSFSRWTMTLYPPSVHSNSQKYLEDRRRYTTVCFASSNMRIRSGVEVVFPIPGVPRAHKRTHMFGVLTTLIHSFQKDCVIFRMKISYDMPVSKLLTPRMTPVPGPSGICSMSNMIEATKSLPRCNATESISLSWLRLSPNAKSFSYLLCLPPTFLMGTSSFHFVCLRLSSFVVVCRRLSSFVAIRLTSSKEPSQMDFFDLDFIRWTMTFRRGTISLELPPITLAPESLATAYSPLLSPTAQPAPTFPYYNNPWFGNGLPSGRAS